MRRNDFSKAGSVEEAAIMLESYGSNHDPIYHHGIETTPEDLRYSEHADKPASGFRIGYFAIRGRGIRRIRRGTLRGMLRDRRRHS